jgi:multiple sugar transport system substrate-binding protein
VIADQIAAFDRQRDDVTVELTFLPEGSYSGQVQAATAAGTLPDVLELDGPNVPRAAWQGALRPLDGLVDEALLENLLPSVLEQGRYDGRLWSVATFDSGLGLFVRRSALEAAGARLPAHPRDAWTADELDELLAELAAEDPDGAVLDLKLNYPDEFFTYALMPALVSGGGDLVDRKTYRASGTLDSPASVAVLERIQGWFERGLVDPNLDDAAFTSGRVPVSWVGHWEHARYADTVGNDLTLVPLPDFGHGSRTGQGSWCWTVTRRCRRPDVAAALLEFLLEPSRSLEMTGANGAVPAVRAAIGRSDRFGAEGPLQLYVVQLEGRWAVPRPRTPAYPFISAAFARAFRDIRNGHDVASVLGRAAADIDRNREANRGYPPPSERDPEGS